MNLVKIVLIIHYINVNIMKYIMKIVQIYLYMKCLNAILILSLFTKYITVFYLFVPCPIFYILRRS